MIPSERLSLEHDVGNDCEHDEADTFLHNLQLYQRERPAVSLEPDSVGRHLAAILKEGNAPREGNDAYQRPIAWNATLL